MLERCYSGKYLEIYPTYAGCTVSEEFKQYQKFSDWAVDQVGVDQINWCLDKDLLVKGNKVYNRDVCVFVPRAINMVILRQKAVRGSLPIGVSLNQGRYMATICLYGRNKNLGRFNTSEEAFSVYKTAKETYLKSLANEYSAIVDPRVVEALNNYSVEVYD